MINVGHEIYTIVNYIFVPKNREETDKMQKEIRKVWRGEYGKFHIPNSFDKICFELEDFLYHSDKMVGSGKKIETPIYFSRSHGFSSYGGVCYWIVDSVDWEDIPIIRKMLEVLKEKNIEVEAHGFGFYLWSIPADLMEPKKGIGYSRKKRTILGKDLPQIIVDEEDGYVLRGRGRQGKILNDECRVVFIDQFYPQEAEFHNCMFWMKGIDSSDWRAIPVIPSFKIYEKNLEKFLFDYPKFSRLFGDESGR